MSKHVPCFIAGGIDLLTDTAYLYFDQNRTVYSYSNVTESAWRAWIYGVPRRGTSFNAVIRALPATYPYVQLTAFPAGLSLKFEWSRQGFYVQ
jgi:hypothetical protein